MTLSRGVTVSRWMLDQHACSTQRSLHKCFQLGLLTRKTSKHLNPRDAICIKGSLVASTDWFFHAILLGKCLVNMALLDSDVANGTCYYAFNKAAGSELVPCGNAGIANVACCFSGDYCDEENTCYNSDSELEPHHAQDTHQCVC